MRNVELVQNNDMHKLHWDFEIETNHIISERKLELLIVNKQKKSTCWIVDFAVPADHIVRLKEG